tara:strand:- start:184 stop:915 length:732 start_codon:yes stop_codon:yes gene_type:complete
MVSNIKIDIGTDGLDETFQYMSTRLKGYDIWKIGAYFTHIVEHHNSLQGIFIENIFKDVFNGEKINDSVVRKVDINGDSCKLKIDFIMPNEVGIQCKSIIQKVKIFNRLNDVHTSGLVEIFDTGRRKYKENQKNQLIQLLTECGWESNLLVYIYEKELRRSCICLTSLKEIASDWNGGTFDKSTLVERFHYKEGMRPFHLDRLDIYNSAKLHDRVIFSQPKENEVDVYLKNCKEPTPMVDLIF